MRRWNRCFRYGGQVVPSVQPQPPVPAIAPGRHRQATISTAICQIYGSDPIAFLLFLLERLEKLVGESASGGMRHETAVHKADRIVAEELKRLRWTEQDLMRRRKSDPGKLRIAARLRRETIMSLKSIAARVGLGSSKSANAKLHAWMQADGKPDGADARTMKRGIHAKKENRTKA
jgi:hypothetical protein